MTGREPEAETSAAPVQADAASARPSPPSRPERVRVGDRVTQIGTGEVCVILGWLTSMDAIVRYQNGTTAAVQRADLALV